MSQNNEQSIECQECKYIFQPADLEKGSEKRRPCPNCGSLKRNFFVSAHTTIGLSDFIGLKVKKYNSKHKKNRPDYEAEKGVRKGKNGESVFIRKEKDREHQDMPGSYVEYVRDKDGNIKVNKYEKLSEHTSPPKKVDYNRVGEADK